MGDAGQDDTVRHRGVRIDGWVAGDHMEQEWKDGPVGDR